MNRDWVWHLIVVVALALAVFLIFYFAAPGLGRAEELKYFEIDGTYKLADGQWGSVVVSNPEQIAIRIVRVDIGLAIDNGLTADLGVYLTRLDNSVIAIGSFTLEVQHGAMFPLTQTTQFSPHWITVAPGESLRLSYVGYANWSLVRNYIAVARIHYYTVAQ